MVQSSSLEGFSRSQNRPVVQGEFSQKIERQTARIPSVALMTLALGSMAVSAGLAIFGNRKETANFVGLWAPSFLLIGIFNKLHRLEESEFMMNQKKVG